MHSESLTQRRIMFRNKVRYQALSWAIKGVSKFSRCCISLRWTQLTPQAPSRLKMPNQWKPNRKSSMQKVLTLTCVLAPLELIEPLIKKFWEARLNDRQILEALHKNIDMETYGIG